MPRYLHLSIIILLTCVSIAGEFPVPKLPFEPENYICFRSPWAIILDGKLDEPAWQNVPWTNEFVDIEGSLKPLPTYRTLVKMLWDDTYFYIGAVLEEPHVWATLKKRDSVIFYDNDFEVFIDPDDDTHNYYELEVNALATEWDLLLLAPYRDQGKVAVDSWDINGLVTAVFINGSLNDPSDTDAGWSLEIAIPWQVLEECAPNSLPAEGEQWRVNFSRVQWDTKITNGNYEKLKVPEHNWVWSPQGLVNMHYPERWGYVQFTRNLPADSNKVTWKTDGEKERAYAVLRQLYYDQRQFFEDHGRWAPEINSLNNTLNSYNELNPVIIMNNGGYEASIEINDKRMYVLNQQGKTWFLDN